MIASKRDPQRVFRADIDSRAPAGVMLTMPFETLAMRMKPAPRAGPLVVEPGGSAAPQEDGAKQQRGATCQ